MKLFSFAAGGVAHIGAELRHQLIDLPAAYTAFGTARGLPPGAPRALPSDMMPFIQGGEATLSAAKAALAFMARRPALPVGLEVIFPFDGVQLLPPIPRPGKVLCGGVADGAGLRFSAKFASSIIGSGAPIRHPGAGFAVQAQAELAAVLGKVCHRTSQANALAHIFGYTMLNNISVRSSAGSANDNVIHGNFDTFAPMGPCLVTADEIPNVENLQILTRLNAAEVARNPSDSPLTLPQAIEWLSARLTLEPGDVVAIRAGGAASLIPLSVGDICELEASGIGTLSNSVVAS